MKKSKLTDGHITDNPVNRRTFLKKAGTILGGMTLINGGLIPARGLLAAAPFAVKGNHQEKLIFIAIDGLHPKYLELDARGLPGGSEGNWLMSHIRAFLKKSLWYPNAKCYLPSATDMNHLNALAGTSSAQTGIISVWAQPTGWAANGKAIISRTNISFARDDKGNPVDTLFKSWKRRYPESKTLFVTGKAWVGEMLRGNGNMPSGIDILATGTSHPDYLAAPQRESLVDPVTDADAVCDPKSSHLGFFGGNMNPSHVMTRLFTGQGAVPARHMEQHPEHFPHDSWIVDSTLEIFRREKPGMAYILLAQCDDACHVIGNAWDRSEFVNADPPYVPPVGCENRPEYQLISSRNKLLFREAILDVIRDVDIQFGRLVDGLKAQGTLDNANVILLSDHSAVNHLYTDDFSSTDFAGLLEKAGLLKKGGLLEAQDMYSLSASSYGVLYWRKNKETIPAAKKLLLEHTALNPQTNVRECPWWVLDREDMKKGVEGVCLPGELYHTYYVDIDRENTMIWPNLIILAKNGWQVPVYNGKIPNIGVKVPEWTPPWRVVNGGHGSVDTLPIVAAISVPGGRTGINGRPIRISDLGVTAASLSGLILKSSNIGKDLSKDLK